ncbi:MAG: double-stranded RNA binding motif domain-containing protein, partial [Eubacteriales bacterium]|nr:double-stranded RNA binding motif domain-containing protein [Eubacteriales bacterium]
RSQKVARLEAARAACERIEKTEKTVFIVDEVGEPTLERAINQLQELFQKGLIGEIKYCYQGDVNTYWVCECTVPGYGTTSGQDYNKKEAKKEAAYDMLRRIIEEKNGK